MDDDIGAGSVGESGDITGQTAGGPLERCESAARRFVLAGIGAMATAYDTAEETVDRFVDRGAQVQNEWQERTDDVRQRNLGARSRLGDYLRSGMDAFLNTLNVPSKGDIDTINVKLNIVSRKLDDLQMQQVREAQAEREEEPPAPPPGPDLDLKS